MSYLFFLLKKKYLDFNNSKENHLFFLLTVNVDKIRQTVVLVAARIPLFFLSFSWIGMQKRGEPSKDRGLASTVVDVLAYAVTALRH